MRYSITPMDDNDEVFIVRTKSRILGRLHRVRNKWAAFTKNNTYTGISGTDREAVAHSLYLERTYGKD